MTKSSSGTSDTVTGSRGSVPGVCPCGREHPRAARKRRNWLRKPSDHEELVGRVYEALSAGKVEADSVGRQIVRYAGNCHNPLAISQNAGTGALFVRWQVRCRKCPACRRAKMWYWTYAAIHQTQQSLAAGRRTWFGTLTLTPEWQAEFERRAREGFMAGYGSSDIPAWWDDPTCDERFQRVRDEIVPELQKFWKRLRKGGHRFKYLLVFERHKSGLPHMHFLLHEQEAPILKRHLEAEWPFGFTKIKLVGGSTYRKRDAVQKAAFYVAKYLQKSDQSRQLASEGYRPPPRNVKPEDKASRSAL